MKFLKVFFIKYIFFLSLLLGCGKGFKYKHPLTYSCNCESIQIFKVDINNLVDSAFFYNNLHIETEGFLDWGPEDFSLLASKNSKNKNKIIELQANCDLIRKDKDSLISLFNYKELNKLKNKKVLIRGVVDLNHTRLPFSYLFSLKKICFIKLIE